MTVDEVFSTLSAHMIKGMMTHEQLANYYNFLGLKGYAKCHEYHFMHETCEYRKLYKHFIENHNKLIPYKSVEDPEVIPSSWYMHVRQDVDNNTKKNAVRNGLTTWSEWEKETKKLYEQLYKELRELDEISDMCKVKCLIEDVSHELHKVEKYQLNKKAIDYDLVFIIGEQHDMKHKYCQKIKEIMLYV